MKSILLRTIMLLGVLFAGSSLAWAATTSSKTFTLSASLPAATGLVINASSINSATGIFTPVSVLTLSFDPMTLDPVNQIYLPNHFFAIDVAPAGGAGGSVNVSFTYTDQPNPNTPGHGLGWKSTATFIKVAGVTGSQTETGITSHGPKKLLKDLNGENILATEYAGGFLRTYLGIVTLDPNATFKDPAGSEPFTNGDKSGSYSGTLLVSATLL